ncbi:MAG: hypothetical protein NT076_03880 [Candidatus Pacearchaeota archaeon]|nr:hypothetical protein [Candidatus Pacearchaeota archaeon]
MIKELLIIIILILAFPVGYFLAYFCKEELVSGRKWFLSISILGFVAGIIFLFFNLVSSLTCFFISIVSFVSFCKSYDKRFTKN